jgi:transposase
MAQGKSRDPKRERFWRRHLRSQRASGLTIRDYCVEHDLSESSFHFWRREIADRDRRREAAESTAAPAFVPVTIVEPPAVGNAAIDIRLAGGHRLRVRAGCDPLLLAEVVAVLERRPC